jgi:signal transduction histidine kinase
MRPRFWGWWRTIPPFAADSALVLVLLGLAVYEYADPGNDGHQAGSFLLNGPLTLAELLPLAWRRRAPLVTFVLGFGSVIVPSLLVAHTLFAYSGNLPQAIYLYTVARHCDARVSRWALLAPVVATFAYAVHVSGTLDAPDIFSAVLVFSIAWITGRVARREATQQAALTDALAQLGHDQQQRERLAILEERAHLARDLHDVVAHAVALMLVQSGAARLALDSDLDEAKAGVLALEQTGREATSDLRRLLGLLRADEGSAALTTPSGLGQLHDLIKRMTSAGLDIDLQVTGNANELAPSVNMSAFRIVQEALTNVVKHAGPTRVQVRVDIGDPVRISVTDDGPVGPLSDAPASGHGLLGMHERVALFGGTLHADRHEHGFAVHAELPLPQAAI